MIDKQHLCVENATYDVYWMRIDDKPKSKKSVRLWDLRQLAFVMNATFSAFSTDHGPNLYPFGTVQQPARKKVRLTYFPGADVLPVFSPDYRKIMWTSTRGGGDSQLYIADFVPPKDDE